ncbi:MAG: CHAT domain-containing protein [Planctomycetes bacterium]|nr:CHAT domain-containing protein [Planctomycetota bacterium]MCB9891275.1 CHAT domain-containing protein [Planctomycetota bacterium]MCB9919466.1 CHAT domain-containing protein [Planctomycetota bacterium]
MSGAWIAWIAVLAVPAQTVTTAANELRRAIELAREQARKGDAATAAKTIEAALVVAGSTAGGTAGDPKEDAAADRPTPSDFAQAYRIHAACSERIPGGDAIAERSYRAALRHYDQVDDDLKFDIDRSYAMFLRSHERAARALDHARRAWQATTPGTDVCAQSLLAVASCLTDLGRDAEVIRLLEADFVPSETSYSIPARVYLCFALALAHLESEEHDAAGERASHAYTLAVDHPESGLVNLATQRYATILLGCGDPKAAVPLLRSAYAIQDGTAPAAQRIQTAVNLGRSLQELAHLRVDSEDKDKGSGSPDEKLLTEAADYFREAIDLAEASSSQGDFETAWSHYRLAMCLRQLGELREAEKHIQKASVVLLRLSRAERKLPELHGQHQRALRTSRVFHEHASLLLDLPGSIDESKVFDLVESATSSLDLQSLDLARFDRVRESAQAFEQRHPDTSVRKRWEEANTRMLRATRRLFVDEHEDGAEEKPASSATADDELERAFDELRLVEDELGAPTSPPMRVHLSQCMATLSDGEAMLQFILDVERPFAMVVTQDTCKLLRLPAEASSFEARAGEVMAAIAPGDPSVGTGSNERGKPVRRAPGRPARTVPDSLSGVAAAMMPADVRDALAGSRSVYIVGTAKTAGFPYEILPWGDEGRWIDHGPAVVHLSSASLLTRLRDREDFEPRSAAVLAGCPRIGAAEPESSRRLHWRKLDELPKTHEELERVRRTLDAFRDFSLVPGSCVRLEGADATEQRFFEALDDARFVHIASHGLTTSVGKRAFGGIVFSMSTGSDLEDDGFVSIRELFTNRWRGKLRGTEMVVLSACETATNRARRPETAATLPLGFLFAGCRCVVGTMWKVQDDTTAAFMAKFYEELAHGGGLDRALALHRTKQWAAKTQPQTRHWAPFAMFGSGRETR